MGCLLDGDEMQINTNKMISMTEANQNFSKVARMVDANKSIIILKNNKPKYVVIEFEEFSKEALSDNELLNNIAKKVLNENIIAFKELAK